MPRGCGSAELRDAHGRQLGGAGGQDDEEEEERWQNHVDESGNSHKVKKRSFPILRHVCKGITIRASMVVVRTHTMPSITCGLEREDHIFKA